MSDSTRLRSTIHVSSLPPPCTQSTLHAAFLPFGTIVDITLPRSDVPSSAELHRGFGYIEFELAEDAKEAIDNMDQSELFGRVIKVQQAKEKKSTNEGLGSRTALWQQEGWLAKNAVSDEDRQAVEQAQATEHEPIVDPMQGLEGLDVAGPKQA